MVIAVVERLLALLALLAAGISVAGLILLLTGRIPLWVSRQVALPLAAAVAVVATVGSLFASEVAGYPPCILCWYQRGAMYPLALVLTIAAVRSSRRVWQFSVPVATVGAGIAAWHITVERMPGAPDGVCDPEAPCSVLWINEFGFLTLPTMALIGFVTIMVLVLLARSADRTPSPEADVPHETPDVQAGPGREL